MHNAFSIKTKNKIKTNPGGEHCKMHITPAQYPMGRVPRHTRKGGEGLGNVRKKTFFFKEPANKGRHSRKCLTFEYDFSVNFDDNDNDNDDNDNDNDNDNDLYIIGRFCVSVCL